MDELNKTLDGLYDILIDNAADFQSDLKRLIANPEKIANTNKFATLLINLRLFGLIGPLLETISTGKKGDTWLCDFIYTVSSLLDECDEDEEFETPEKLVDVLGNWILNTTGQLSWYAAGLLKFHPKGEKIQLKKLEQRDDFFLAYVECILGLLRYHRKKYLPLVREIAKDETRDEKLREFCNGIVNRKIKAK